MGRKEGEEDAGCLSLAVVVVVGTMVEEEDEVPCEAAARLDRFACA